jgi:glucose-6-phosphate isomerase
VSVIDLLGKLKTELANSSGTAEQLAQKVEGSPELSFKILEHLAANGSIRKEAREPWFESIYTAK